MSDTPEPNTTKYTFIFEAAADDADVDEVTDDTDLDDEADALDAGDDVVSDEEWIGRIIARGICKALKLEGKEQEDTDNG